MPFTGRHPGWYTWAVLIGTSVVSAMLSIFISVQIAEKQRVESDRKQCASIQADVNAYREQASKLTEVGKAQLHSKEERLRQLGCSQVLKERP
jgi:hypothetical protein